MVAAEPSPWVLLESKLRAFAVVSSAWVGPVFGTVGISTGVVLWLPQGNGDRDGEGDGDTDASVRLAASSATGLADVSGDDSSFFAWRRLDVRIPIIEGRLTAAGAAPSEGLSTLAAGVGVDIGTSLLTTSWVGHALNKLRCSSSG